MSDDALSLTCPLCGQSHRYQLAIVRSRVLAASAGDVGPPTSRRKFVRLFTCPATASRFQAEITLTESALARIQSLEVSAAGELGDE